MATRSRPSWPSASRSNTERLLAALAGAALVAVAGCGGDDSVCGPGDAPVDGVTVAESTFGQFWSSPNNDCPPPGGSGPTSLTVQGAQTDPEAPVDSTFLVLCLPRPDEIGSAPIPLTDSDRVQLIDLVATDADDCDVELDRDRPLAGTITFSGFCGDGDGDEGYAISFDATVPMLRTCSVDGEPGEPEPIEAEVGGRVAVDAQQPLQARPPAR